MRFAAGYVRNTRLDLFTVYIQTEFNTTFQNLAFRSVGLDVEAGMPMLCSHMSLTVVRLDSED